MSDLPEKFDGTTEAVCPLYMDDLAMSDSDVLAHGAELPELHEAEFEVCSVYTRDLA